MKKYFLLIPFTLISFFLHTQDLSFTNHITISSGSDGGRRGTSCGGCTTVAPGVTAAAQ